MHVRSYASKGCIKDVGRLQLDMVCIQSSPNPAHLEYLIYPQSLHITMTYGHVDVAKEN
jgi:hypothetical protein